MIHIRANGVLNDEPLEAKVLLDRLENDLGPSDMIDMGSAVVRLDEDVIKGRGLLRDYFEARRRVAVVAIDENATQCIAYSVERYSIN